MKRTLGHSPRPLPGTIETIVVGGILQRLAERIRRPYFRHLDNGIDEESN